MNNDMEYVETEYNDQKNQIPWLKIGIIAGIVILLIIIFLLLKGCSNKEYKIRFDSVGGTIIAEQIINKGDYVIKPIDPVKEGYDFLGWYYDNEPYDFNEPVKKDMTLIAGWEASEDRYYYVVIFDTNGGAESIESQQVEENKTAIRPTDPVKSGYTFEGWYLFDTKYDFTSKVTSDIILTAKWKKNSTGSTGGGGTTVTPKPTEYTITFNSNEGSSVPSQTVKSGGKVTKPNNPTRVHYEFEGWYSNGSLYDFNTAVTSNITLIAKWRQADKYTVTFNTQGGTSISAQTVYKNDKVTMPSTNPSKSYYTFTGWYLNGQPYNFDTKVTKNITLVAGWESFYSFSIGANESSISIFGVDLPSGYTIKYKKGNVSSSEVISSGTKVGMNANNSGTISIQDNANDYYTIVASVGSKEVVTKRVYVYRVASSSEKSSVKTVNLANNITGIDKVVMGNANATAVISNSQLKITAEAIKSEYYYYCEIGTLVNGECLDGSGTEVSIEYVCKEFPLGNPPYAYSYGFVMSEDPYGQNSTHKYSNCVWDSPSESECLSSSDVGNIYSTTGECYGNNVGSPIYGEYYNYLVAVILK